MKLQINFTPQLELDIPLSFYQASTLQQFQMLVANLVENATMSPDNWKVNPYQLKELEREFLKRKRGIV